MALPKLNQGSNYRMTIPSTGVEVSYRPYLVKEEKQMMIANETGDQKEMMRVMAATINECVEDDINVNSLTTFDVEYMFTQIRSRSVGETSTVSIECGEEGCNHKTEITVNLTEAKVDDSDVDMEVKLTDNITLEMKWPSYHEVTHYYDGEDGNEVEFGFNMLSKCILAVATEDERTLASDTSDKELEEFIESMTSNQLEKLANVINNIPQLGLECKWECESCGSPNEYKLRGLQDFFS